MIEGEEEIFVECYLWFGWNNRKLWCLEGSEGVRQSRAAGVGGCFREYTEEVLETDVEDVLWVRAWQSFGIE